MSKPLGKPDRIVVALGGNALGNTPEEQIEKVAHAAQPLLGLNEQGNQTMPISLGYYVYRQLSSVHQDSRNHC